MSELFSQRERSSSSNQFKTKTEAMSIRQPSFGNALADAVDPNHPGDGEGVPAEVEVRTETVLTDPRNPHGDAIGSRGIDPGLATIRRNQDSNLSSDPNHG